jgi:hypothetical protein
MPGEVGQARDLQQSLQSRGTVGQREAAARSGKSIPRAHDYGEAGSVAEAQVSQIQPDDESSGAQLLIESPDELGRRGDVEVALQCQQAVPLTDGR